MALGRPADGVVDVAVDALVARIAIIEPDPPRWVVLETRHGMLVERLVDAGYVVVPVNPDLVARRRGLARKKDDAEDARIAWHIALDRFERLRPLVPHGEQAAELRAIARDDERANRDERRLLIRLRAGLIATSPLRWPSRRRRHGPELSAPAGTLADGKPWPAPRGRSW